MLVRALCVSLASFLLVVPARAGESPPTLATFLFLEVNYGSDWVQGGSDAALVSIQVEDSGNSVKATATVDTNAGRFFVAADDWNPSPPDILPGDSVWASADALASDIDPVGSVTGALDLDADTVSGTVNADWFPGPLALRCEIAGQAPGTFISLSVDPDGGIYSCDFDDVAWDLTALDGVLVSYAEPDGDRVFNRIGLSLFVNYRDDLVAGYSSDTDVSVSTEDSGASVKATADLIPGWGNWYQTLSSSWLPSMPDIVPGDAVRLSTTNHNLDIDSVGLIAATLDVENDSIAGTITVSLPSPTDLPVECQSWAEGIDAPSKLSSARSDGSVPFSCQWNASSEWDIVPGQDLAVIYTDPAGGEVANVFSDPIAHLVISKNADGQAAAGENFRFRISFANLGDAAAQDVTVTDTLPKDFAYLSDTSGLPVTLNGSGVAWDAGTVEPESTITFDMFATVPVQTGVFTNWVTISTTDYDSGDPGDKSDDWVGSIVANDTHLRVAGIGAVPEDPAPGQLVVYRVTICNDGSTASDDLVLEHTLPAGVDLLSWYSDSLAGWSQPVPGGDPMTLTVPSFPANSCSDVVIRSRVNAGTQFGTLLHNVAEIASDSDLDLGDNFLIYDHYVQRPRPNVAVAKVWAGGSLTPGGYARYRIEVLNEGNWELGPLLLIETLPAGTGFVEARVIVPGGSSPFPPSSIGSGVVVWEIPALEAGEELTVEVLLSISPTALPSTIISNSVEICVGQLPAMCDLDFLEQRSDDNVGTWAEALRAPGPNLRVVKTHEWWGDERIGYSIRFENVGSDVVETVTVTDTLPVDVAYAGEYETQFPRAPSGFTDEGDRLIWDFDAVHPGEIGWIWFEVILNHPGEPLTWFSNVAEITVHPDDASPADNFFQNVAFSGGEVQSVDLMVAAHGEGVWGIAEPGTTVNVTTDFGTFAAWADPACEGCWSVPNPGPLCPGHSVLVTAGGGSKPVAITIPSPFEARQDAAAATIFGRVDSLDSELVEAEPPGGYRSRFGYTSSSGDYEIPFEHFPDEPGGVVRYRTQIDYAQVTFHRLIDLTIFSDGFECGDTAQWTVTAD